MSSDPPIDLYPIMVVEDRYQGVHSGGSWWAVARADEPFEGMTRLQWLIETGPSSDDVTCAVFWNTPPPWIASGSSPNEAVAVLGAKPHAATNEWQPPSREDDPRASGLPGGSE